MAKSGPAPHRPQCRYLPQQARMPASWGAKPAWCWSCPGPASV